MSESNGHNGKPADIGPELYAVPEPRELERVELCTKSAWCTEPSGHPGGCIVFNPRLETPIDPMDKR